MMHAYSREQKTVEIRAVKFGGQPGQNPTVLLGTLFYGKKYPKLDGKTLDKAKKLIQGQETVSRETGIPGLVDVYVREESRLKTEIDLVVESTDKPFSIDISESELRIKALEYLDEAGVLDRVIYNSVNLGITDKEVKALEKHTPAAAIMLAYNPKDTSVDGRIEILQSGAGMICVKEKNIGLLELAQNTGIGKILIDTGATPFGQQAAETLRAIPVLKNEYGLPVGCSIHNTLESWVWMRKNPERERIYGYCDAAVNALVPMMSGDFILYGPADAYDKVFPSIAFVDKLVAEGAADYFGIEPSEGHPYHRLE
jgi:tetrahydromethanopterin S-methyltransferase subunit H